MISTVTTDMTVVAVKTVETVMAVTAAKKEMTDDCKYWWL